MIADERKRARDTKEVEWERDRKGESVTEKKWMCSDDNAKGKHTLLYTAQHRRHGNHHVWKRLALPRHRRGNLTHVN